jgi:hypothetical protein
MGSKFTAAMLMVIVSFAANADVVNPGHINKQFQFTNLDKFPGYTFYYLHTGYHYDRGYHRNPADTVLVENNKRYTVSERGSDVSVLLAKDRNGKFTASTVKFGGAEIAGPTVKGIIDVFTITTIKKAVVKIKKDKEILQYENGEEKVRKSGSGILGFIGGDDFTNGLAVTSAVALVGLLILFMLRIRKPKYIQLAS